MKKIFTLFAALAMVMSMSAAPYLKGTFNSWSDSNSLSSGSTTVTLNANAVYDFKVNDGNTWYGNSGTMESTNCTDWTMSASVQDNCKIKTTIAGVYTFKWDASSKKLSVVYPTEAVEINFYITGTSNLVGGDGWQANEIKMTNNDGTYTHTFTALAAGNYEMKITQGDWSNTLGFSNLAAAYVGVTGNNDNNIVMALTEATNLTVTVTGTTVSLNLPEKTNTVYFVNETDWSKVHAYVWANDPYKPWPGEAMTKVEGKTYNGKDVYTYTYPANCSNVIFNDGSSNQTSDLTYSEATPYYYNSKWNASIEYDKTTYTVTVTATAEGEDVVTGGGEYAAGEEVTVTASEELDGWVFIGWTEDGEFVANDPEYTFVVDGDIELVAVYAMDLGVNEVTDLVIDGDNRLLTGSIAGFPMGTMNLELALGEYDEEEGAYLLTEESKLYVGETNFTFVDGMAAVDMNTNSAMAIVVFEDNGTYYYMTVNMSAATAEPVELVLTDAIVAINEETGTLTFNVPTEEGEGYYVELAGYTEPGVYEGPQVCLLETPEVVAFGTYAEVVVENGVYTLTCNGMASQTGQTFDLTVSGTVQQGPTGVENLNGAVAPVKMIENGQLIVIKDGVKFNAQGAVVK